MENQETQKNANQYYKVGANMDQLVKAGLDKKYIWDEHHLVKNRVFTYFENDEFEKADQLYRQLKDNGLIASKNWMS